MYYMCMCYENFGIFREFCIENGRDEKPIFLQIYCHIVIELRMNKKKRLCKEEQIKHQIEW